MFPRSRYRLLESRVPRKWQARFGGGHTEKARRRDLAGCLPYRMYCANKAGNNICEGRHRGHGVNIAFADGHAAFIPGERIRGGVADKREWPIVNPNMEPWK
jgi:prepilin-type processing-associated H-X9-DG protein